MRGLPRQAASRSSVLVHLSSCHQDLLNQSATPHRNPPTMGTTLFTLFCVGSAQWTLSNSLLNVTFSKSPICFWNAGSVLHKGPVNMNNWAVQVTVNSSVDPEPGCLLSPAAREQIWAGLPDSLTFLGILLKRRLLGSVFLGRALTQFTGHFSL